MENSTSFDKSLRSLRRCYPALYECDCPLLSRKSGSFRRYTEQKVVQDLCSLILLVRSLRPFVLVFNRVGGSLAEARILFLLKRRLKSLNVRVVVIEPLVTENLVVGKAVEDFSRFVRNEIGSAPYIVEDLVAYRALVGRDKTLRADACIVIDSDEAGDLIFTLDSWDNHARFNQVMQSCSRPLVYVARLGVDQCHGGASRQLHRSLVFWLPQGNLLVVQLFSFGFDQFAQRLAFAWLDGKQLLGAEDFQNVSELAGGECLVVGVQRVLMRYSFAPLGSCLRSVVR